MDVSEVLAHCQAKPGAWPDNPWDHEHPCFKVGPGKIFAFAASDHVGVKAGAGREIADEWIERYPDDASVMAYIGRYGWNSVRVGGKVPDEEICELIDTSYDEIVAWLPKAKRP